MPTKVKANNTTEAIGSGKGTEVVKYAKKFLGKPYVYGGSWNGKEPYTPTDCSGFVGGVYKHFGINLPRTSSEQSKVGKKVASVKDAQPGDLMFYGSNGSVGHVTMYMGNNKVIHASNEKDGIKTTSPANYRPIIVIRRVLK